MSGVTIIGVLLGADGPVLDLVPAERIKAGRLPDGIALPALLIRSVSLVERQPLKRLGWVRVTERVSVTVRAGSYRDQRTVIRLSRPACAGKTGTIAGSPNLSVLSAGTGPDVAGPNDTFEQTQDFRVSFDAPA